MTRVRHTDKIPKRKKRGTVRKYHFDKLIRRGDYADFPCSYHTIYCSIRRYFRECECSFPFQIEVLSKEAPKVRVFRTE